MTAVFAVGGIAAKGIGKGGAKSIAGKVIGSELTESLIKNGADPELLATSVRRLQKVNVSEDAIRNLAENVGSEGLERFGRLSANNSIPESLVKAMAGMRRQCAT